MESFFASLKTERVHEARFRTRAEARAAVFEYIAVFYNRQRLHSALAVWMRDVLGSSDHEEGFGQDAWV
jgi:transposase InsO family protein